VLDSNLLGEVVLIAWLKLGANEGMLPGDLVGSPVGFKDGTSDELSLTEGDVVTGKDTLGCEVIDVSLKIFPKKS